MTNDFVTGRQINFGELFRLYTTETMLWYFIESMKIKITLTIPSYEFMWLRDGLFSDLLTRSRLLKRDCWFTY